MSYERALFADLDRLLAELPHDRVAVQWDVAVEFAILEGGFEGTPSRTFDAIVEIMVRSVDHVPEDIPMGLHLCYGDSGTATSRNPSRTIPTTRNRARPRPRSDSSTNTCRVSSLRHLHRVRHGARRARGSTGAP